MTAALKGHRVILSSKTLGTLAALSPRWPMMRDEILTHAIPNSTLNMFSFVPRSTHLARKRIFAPVYSRSSTHGPRVQHILSTRTAMLTQFLSNQTSVSPTGRSGNLIPRNFIRALGTDVFTAFAFSDAESTTYLNELRAGANTMKELGMDIWELWHEDKRDSFFFFESEPGLQVFRSFFAPHGRDIHVRFETWVESVMRQYEARVSSCFKSECEEKGSSEQGVYWRLLTYRSPTTRQPLSWHERASEIMDHMGTPVFFPLSFTPSSIYNSRPRPPHLKKQRLSSHFPKYRSRS